MASMPPNSNSGFPFWGRGNLPPFVVQLALLAVTISRRLLLFLYTLAKEGVILGSGTRSAPSLLDSIDPEPQAGKEFDRPDAIQVRAPRGPRPLQAVGLKLDGPMVSPARYPDLTHTVRAQLLRRKQLGLGPGTGLGLTQPSLSAASPVPGPGPPPSRPNPQGTPAWTLSVRVYSGCLMLVIQFWHQYRTQRAPDPGPALNGLTPMRAIPEDESVAASLHSLQSDVDTSIPEESGGLLAAPPDEEAAAEAAEGGVIVVAEAAEAAAAGAEGTGTVLAVAASGDLGGLVSLSEILQLLPEDLRDQITSAHDMTGADAPIRILSADVPYLLAPEPPRSSSALVALRLSLAPCMPQPETVEEARRVYEGVAWQGPDEEPPQFLPMLSWEIVSRAGGGGGLGATPLRRVEVGEAEGAGDAQEAVAAGTARAPEAAEGPGRGAGFDGEEGGPAPLVGEGSQGSSSAQSGSGSEGPRGSRSSFEIGGLPALRMRARGGGGVEHVPETPLTATGASTSSHVLGGTPGTVPTPQSLLTTPLDMYGHRGGIGTPGTGPKSLRNRASFQLGSPGPGPGGFGAAGQGPLLEDAPAPSLGSGEGAGAGGTPAESAPLALEQGASGTDQGEPESGSAALALAPDAPQPLQPGREPSAPRQAQTAVEVRMLVEVPLVVRGIGGDPGPGPDPFPAPAPGPSPLCSLVHLGVECGQTGASCLPLSIPVLPWGLAAEIPGGEDGEEILSDMVAMVSMKEGGVEGSDPFLLRVVRHLEEYAVGTGKSHLADFCASLTTPPPTATAPGPALGQEDTQLQAAAAGDRGGGGRIRGWLWPRRLPALISGGGRAGAGGLAAGGGADAAPEWLEKEDQADQGGSDRDKRRRARYIFLEVLPSVARNVLAFLLLLWLVKWFLEVGPGSPSLPGPAEAVPAAPAEVPAGAAGET